MSEEVIREYIRKHVKVDWHHDPRHDVAEAAATIRVPLYVTSRKVELDERLIEREKLRTHEKAGVKQYSDEKRKVAFRFKLGMIQIDKFLPDLAINELTKKTLETLARGMITETIDGFCDGHLDKPAYEGSEHECFGHECGTLTYTIEGFCDIWPDDATGTLEIIPNSSLSAHTRGGFAYPQPS